MVPFECCGNALAGAVVLSERLRPDYRRRAKPGPIGFNNVSDSSCFSCFSSFSYFSNNQVPYLITFLY
jgi:hypothetical protein